MSLIDAKPVKFIGHQSTEFPVLIAVRADTAIEFVLPLEAKHYGDPVSVNARFL